MVFQDPYASLNPTKKIYDSFDEPMIVHHIGNKEERFERMKEALKMVNVPVEYLDRYPHEFSGGSTSTSLYRSSSMYEARSVNLR